MARRQPSRPRCLAAARLPLLTLIALSLPRPVAAEWSTLSLTTFLLSFFLFFCVLGLLAGKYGLTCHYRGKSRVIFPGEGASDNSMSHADLEDPKNNKKKGGDGIESEEYSQADYEREQAIMKEMDKKDKRAKRKEGKGKAGAGDDGIVPGSDKDDGAGGGGGGSRGPRRLKPLVGEPVPRPLTQLKRDAPFGGRGGAGTGDYKSARSGFGQQVQSHGLSPVMSPLERPQSAGHLKTGGRMPGMRRYPR